MNPVTFEAQAALLAARVHPWPYAKVGLAEYLALHMAWPVGGITELTRPSEALLEQLVDGARAHGLLFNVSAMAGISRAVNVYTDAKREDRRNAQWFASGAIVPPAFTGSLEQQRATAYVTPSRYARKLRRHLEAKVRAFAARFLAFRAANPDVLGVEMEGAAVAQVCRDYGLPFAAVRTISDRADDSAHVDFPHFVRNVASRYADHIIQGLLRAMPGGR